MTCLAPGPYSLRLRRYSFGMDHFDAGVAFKIIHIERQKAAYAVGLHRGDEPGVVHFHPRYAMLNNDPFPLSINCGGVRRSVSKPSIFSTSPSVEGIDSPRPLFAIGRVATFQIPRCSGA